MRFKGFIFVFVALLLAPPGARALSRNNVPDLSRYEGRTVASVEVVVEEASVEESALAEFRAVLKIAEGNRFSAVLVRDSLQALFDTNRVAGARVEASDAAGPPGEGGRPRVALRFVVKPQVLLADVEFEVGVTEGTGISEDELRGRINLLEPGRRLTRQAVEQNADLIQVYLRDRGFYRATVESEQRLDPTRTRATVVFRVEPGPPTTVEAFNIDIEGFDAAALTRLRPDLRLQPGARFTLEALGEDVARVRQAVLAEGRLAPRIDEPDVRLDSQTNRITIGITGAVGPKIAVEIEGYELSEKRQRELLPILREGSVEYSAIVEGERRMENRLQEEGYFFADVTAVCSVQPPFAPPRRDHDAARQRRRRTRHLRAAESGRPDGPRRHHQVHGRTRAPLRADRHPHRGHREARRSKTWRTTCAAARPTCSASSPSSVWAAATRAPTRWSATAA